MKKIMFSGPLAGYFNDFIAMKRAIGYKYETEAFQLKSLNSACLPNSDSLTQDNIESWVCRRSNEKARTYLRRITLSNEFAKYLLLRHVDAYIIPPSQYSTRQIVSYIPYIFSSDELESFFHAVDNHPSHRAHPISSIMYSILFRLLYCCGLRISEAINLTYRDVNATEKTLWISNSKFGKDRIVPMSDSMNGMLREYVSIVQSHYPKNVYLFPSRFSNRSIVSRSAYDYFRRMLLEAGISHKGRGKGPRIHDFRHTFAVHSLHKMIVAESDIYAALPVLATYLGHDNISITERYLRLTADIFPAILQQVNLYCSNVIPEAIFHETN